MSRESPRPVGLESKLRTFCDGLVDVVNEVGDGTDWAFAVELEPGATYVVNSATAIGDLLRISEDFGDLPKHLGLNLDLAHANIVRRTETLNTGQTDLDFRRYKDHIVHAHICDTPGMHTRDQQVGAWSAIELRSAPEYDDLQLLTELANDLSQRKNGLPFTSSVALELEGCGRISWIFHSLSRMKYMTELIKNSSTG